MNEPTTHTPESAEISEERLRRWLMVLRQPDKLASPELEALLRRHGRLPKSPAPLALGQAGAELILEAIERLRPSETGDRDAALPHEVLYTSFVEGAKLFQAANSLGLSERQLSRERSRAIKLLLAELDNAPRVSHSDYLPEPIPRIRGFLDRPAEIRKIMNALDAERLALVHGGPGIGKTCLVAELAATTSTSMPVLWYRFRPAVNTFTIQLSNREFHRHRTKNSIGIILGFRSRPSMDLAAGVSRRLRPARPEHPLSVLQQPSAYASAEQTLLMVSSVAPPI